ncbi:hypothetical protein HPB47_004397 [Ixodes persulcatus]|uniref:Uncharacterized protein n=1 Tax=Ixodes persulcatus TaxID=34615 RepID=A0AC60PG09_IXOPE|nr:hypothetical protein HPB47_004397 [Ixodes persulcatus]
MKPAPHRHDVQRPQRPDPAERVCLPCVAGKTKCGNAWRADNASLHLHLARNTELLRRFTAQAVLQPATTTPLQVPSPEPASFASALGRDSRTDGGKATPGSTRSTIHKSSSKPAVTVVSSALPVQMQKITYGLVGNGSVPTGDTRTALERRQREVGRQALGCHGTVANEAVQGDLGWSSFEAREATSKVSYDGRLRLMDRCRWAKRLFVYTHMTSLQSRWRKRLYQLEKKFGFFTEPVEATTEKEWESVVRKRVREQENVQWLEAARTKSTLTMYAELKQQITAETRLYDNSLGSRLLFEARAGALRTLVYKQRFDNNVQSTVCRQPAARTSGAALQGGLLTQPLPTTSGACFVSIFQGPAYPHVAIPPHSLPQVTSDNQRGQASAAARGTLVSAASTSWQPAAESSERALQPLSPSPVPPRLTEDVFLQMSRKIKQLDDENRCLVRQAALQKTREATFQSHLHKIFTADQLAALSRSSNRGSKWSNETVKESLQMRFACGSTGYDLLLEGDFPLPSSRTLRRRLEGKFVVRLLKCFKAPC